MTEHILTRSSLSSSFVAVPGESLLDDGVTLEGSDADTPVIDFDLDGGLSFDQWLSVDMLLDSDTTAVFQLRFYEEPDSEPFFVQFLLLIQCQARLRIPLKALDGNKWGLGREGGLLKAICGGRRVNPAAVQQVSLALIRTGGRTVRFCMTDLKLTDEEPQVLEAPILPKGALIDRFGQSAVREWHGKTLDTNTMVNHLKKQADDAARASFPDGFSKWGGCLQEQGDATGFFCVEKCGDGWRMLDPDGYAWWSAGMDCVRPNIQAVTDGVETAFEEPLDSVDTVPFVGQLKGSSTVNYLGVNFNRAFGDEWLGKWAEISISELKSMGFNTIANWSELEQFKGMEFPYVRHMGWVEEVTQRIYRDFPDVFDPAFLKEADAFAQRLADTRDDSAMVGYFMMNEPTWGFASECPAAGMLYTHQSSHTRAKLAVFMKERYKTDDALKSAWSMDVSLAALESGVFKDALTKAAVEDLEQFSTEMIDMLFTTLSTACRKVDPNHLNLGIRYAFSPPDWALKGMMSFDVFSINCYRETIPDELGQSICAVVNRPLMIGEWHFGALDAGLPSTGIGHVPTQADRGKAYRIYLEDAASKPWCVGVHYFTMYDQSAIGRFDGENYNIGFLDICNRRYDALAAAALESHKRMYDVRRGDVVPFDDRPDYLPRLF